MRIFVGILLVLLSFESLAQRHQLLDMYRVYEVNGEVHIDCTITAGETCNGIVYYRSLDSINFEVIGQVFGTCGSPDFAVKFKHVDEDPVVNQKAYYRIDFGGWGNTETISITVFDFEDKGFQIRPHPVVDQSIILFHNPAGQESELQVYDLLGRLVFKDQTFDNSFRVDRHQLKPGVHIFNIEVVGSRQSLTGRLLIK